MNAQELARELGKHGKGKAKTLTTQERERRRRDGATRLKQWHKDQGHKMSPTDNTIK